MDKLDGDLSKLKESAVHLEKRIENEKFLYEETDYKMSQLKKELENMSNKYQNVKKRTRKSYKSSNIPTSNLSNISKSSIKKEERKEYPLKNSQDRQKRDTYNSREYNRAPFNSKNEKKSSSYESNDYHAPFNSKSNDMIFRDFLEKEANNIHKNSSKNILDFEPSEATPIKKQGIPKTTIYVDISNYGSEERPASPIKPKADKLRYNSESDGDLTENEV